MAASQAKAEQVAELAEFNENIPLDDGGEQEEVEELSKAEQEIAALVEQVSGGISEIQHETSIDVFLRKKKQANCNISYGDEH